MKSIIIIVLLIFSIYYLFFNSHLLDAINDDKIEAYRLQNDSLKKATDSILLSEKKYQEKLNQQDTFINKQKEEMSVYKNKIAKVNDKISFLKYNYEQANTHANNFSSVELQRYFADSIR